MSKKILVITPSISPGGGPAGYVYNLISGIEKLSKDGQLKNQFEFLGVRSEGRNKPNKVSFKSKNSAIRSVVIFILTKIGLKSFLSKKIRTAKSKINNAEIVIFQGFQDTYLPNYVRKTGLCLAYMPHSPSIFAEEYEMLCVLNGQQCDQTRFDKLKQDEELLINISDVVIFPSKGAAKEYESHFKNQLSQKKLIYIKSGVSVPCEIKKIINAHGKVSILFVGRYVSHKGYDLFCDSAELLSKNISNAQFMTVGDGPMKRSSKSVIDLGWRSDVLDVISNVDIIVVPNRIAYYDLLPIECAALGKPMVMTMVGGNVDQLREFPDSIACDELTPDALAQSILAAMKMHESNFNWGEKNKFKYESDFTERSFAKRWDDAIHTL